MYCVPSFFDHVLRTLYYYIEVRLGYMNPVSRRDPEVFRNVATWNGLYLVCRARSTLCSANTTCGVFASGSVRVCLCVSFCWCHEQIAGAANDLGINDPCYRHQWWTAVELVESPLPEGFSRFDHCVYFLSYPSVFVKLPSGVWFLV